MNKKFTKAFAVFQEISKYGLKPELYRLETFHCVLLIYLTDFLTIEGREILDFQN